MMDCTRLERYVDDYVDGLLDAGVREAVEDHAATCASCRGSIEELRDLRRAVAGLPRELPPSRDLFPEIRAELSRRPAVPWFRWAGVAAAVLVVSVAAWIGLRAPAPTSEHGNDPGAATATMPAASNDLAAFGAAEAEYERATADLLRVLDERGDELSPQTRAIVQENLRVIDDAIDKVRAALEAEPGDPRNGHLLNALHRQKVEFLWRVSRLSS